MSKKQKKISYYFDFSEVLNYFFRKKDPNSKANFFLPVGFILSPIMQNGSSSPIVTVFDELSTIVFVI